MSIPRGSKRRAKPHGYTAALVNSAAEPVPSRKHPVKRRCKNCPKIFGATRKDHEFCSPACRFQFHKMNNTGFGRVRAMFEKELRQIKAELDFLKRQLETMRALLG